MHKCLRRAYFNDGFTIVELLVVIVVIGILAAVTIVAYTGISQKAVIASLQSDLSNASNQLKMFDVEYSKYPDTIFTNCTAHPDSSTNKCLKASPGNSYVYNVDNTISPATFCLAGSHGSTTYRVFNDSPPAPPSNTYILATGGTITNDGCYRTHTFGASCTSGSPCIVTASTNGTINVAISGAGGGGGGGGDDGAGDTGGTGGLSSLSISGGGTTYTAIGGTGGTGGVNCCGSGTDGTPGPTTPNGLTGIDGGGSAGGIGGEGLDGDPTAGFADGGRGGNGGKVSGNISVTTGQTITIVTGSALNTSGAGSGANTTDGANGSPGIVVIKYRL